jgi:hypothetical protein
MPVQPDVTGTIREILRLRQAERSADEELSAQIAPSRIFLERLVGPTIRPADAARLLGVTQPALDRWMKKGDLSTVTTPEGRREVPLSELLDLLEEVDHVRERNGGGRPLGRVINERRRRAADAIDLERLLPRRRTRTHRVADLHSLAYHRLVAERLNQAVLDDARRRLASWIEDGRIDPRWGKAWEEVLSKPILQVARAIGADTTRGRELRQTSPFAGTLNEHERRHLSRAVEERFT